MNVVVVSLFRNAQRYIPRYFNQMADFQKRLNASGCTLFLNLGYGDSQDNTADRLLEYSESRFDVSIKEINHGGKEYGSVVHPERFKNLAQVVNALWLAIPDSADIVFYIESDLVWTAEQMLRLLTTHQTLQRFSSQWRAHTIVAPMVYTKNGWFYDTWAFRYQGKEFRNQAPYHPVLLGKENIVELDSVGSVMCMDAPLALKLHWPEEDLIVGLCNKARSLGARVFLDKLIKVTHP